MLSPPSVLDSRIVALRCRIAAIPEDRPRALTGDGAGTLSGAVGVAVVRMCGNPSVALLARAKDVDQGFIGEPARRLSGVVASGVAAAVGMVGHRLSPPLAHGARRRMGQPNRRI